MEGTPIIIKKKKAHGHAHHGGSWKVAYADFVTAMMAFFMVMWILGLSDEAKAQISGYFNDPMGYSKTAPMSRNIVKFPGQPVTGGPVKQMVGKLQKQKKLSVVYLLKKINQTLAEAAAKGARDQNGKVFDVKSLSKHLNFEMDKDGLRIEFREDGKSVFFESGSATIRPDARALIVTLAPLLAQYADPFKVEGHTDSVPYAGSGYDNWDLSQARANAMRRALQSGGVNPEHFAGVEGYADKKLRDPVHPTSQVNRRVSILLPMPNPGSEVNTPIASKGDRSKFVDKLEKSADGGVNLAEDVQLRENINLLNPKPVQGPDEKPSSRDAFGFRAH